ncbi:MAG: hypothetical protein QXW38_08340 [Candidatus Nitrosotenuis sp.]
MSDKAIQKAKGGRPTKYRPEFVKSTIDYLQKCLDTNKTPYIEHLAWLLGVDDTTLLNWANKYPEFFASIKKLKTLQKYLLMDKGLREKVNPPMAMFLLKSVHGYIEPQHIKKDLDVEIKVRIENAQTGKIIDGEVI